jgi:predicted transcriptional regulator
MAIMQNDSEQALHSAHVIYTHLTQVSAGLEKLHDALVDANEETKQGDRAQVGSQTVVEELQKIYGDTIAKVDEVIKLLKQQMETAENATDTSFLNR